MERTLWKSKLGFILAAAGSAVGLGAIWKFPYVVVENGGGTFLYIYLFFVFTFGLAILMIEMAVGHSTHKSSAAAFRELGGKKWSVVGYLLVLTSFTIMGFYFVVGGWTVFYLVKSFDSSLLVTNTDILTATFQNFSTNPFESVIYYLVFLFLVAGICIAGIQSGLERLSKFLMPIFFILLLVLIARSLTLPNAMEGLLLFITPNFSEITLDMTINALGLTFFTMSVGAGVMLTYGSYLPRSTSLPSSALWVTFLSASSCVLSGLMILPAISSFNVPASLGPILTFVTMPAIFAQMFAGQIFAILFFFLLLVASITSAISMLEVSVAFIIEEFKISRIKASFIAVSLTVMVGIPASLSLGIWGEYTLFGLNFFGILDYLVEKILLPLGGALVSLIVGWKAWGRISQQLLENDSHTKIWLPALRIAYCVVFPALIFYLLWENL